MYVAIVGDLHGLVWHGLQLAVRLQQEVGSPLAAVLCTGDLAYFPDPDHLDKATAKHALDDPDELGFLQHFAAPVRAVQEWLDSLDCPPPPLYFVRGNHEDHSALERYAYSRRPVEVDAYGLIRYLPDDVTLSLTGERSETLRAVGLGGIERGNPRKHHPLRMIQEDLATRLLDRSPGSVDVLLTHDVPASVPGLLSPRRPSRIGSEIVALALEHLQPAYHFCGHMHWQFGPWRQGRTQVVLMNILRGSPDQESPSPCSLALLRWNGPQDHDLTTIEAEWFQTWRWRTPARRRALSSPPSP